MSKRHSLLGTPTTALLAGGVAAASTALALACTGPSPAQPADDGGPSVDAAPACPNDLPAACVAPAPGFDAAVGPILARRCNACHGDGGFERPAHDLGTYAGVFKQRGSVLTQVYGCLMPPVDAAALDPAERAQVLDWLVCGAPNN